MRFWKIGWWGLGSVCAAFLACTVPSRAAPLYASVCDWSHAQQHISIVGGMVSALLETDRRGKYVELLKALEARTPFSYDLEVHSDRRAQRHFIDLHYDAYLLWSNFDPDLTPVRLKLSERSIYAFVREGQAVPSDIKDLKGLRVGLPYVYSFPRALTESPDILAMRLAESAESNLTALIRGRVDVVLVASAAARGYIADQKISGVTFDPERPILTKEIHMVFQDNLGLRCTSELLQAEVELMREDGTLKQLIGD